MRDQPLPPLHPPFCKFSLNTVSATGRKLTQKDFAETARKAWAKIGIDVDFKVLASGEIWSATVNGLPRLWSATINGLPCPSLELPAALNMGSGI